ncbi:hypothetical protein AGABI1DRAFT_51126 [Agaricus bisporus var. burnettii JB137-S8]|uniref:DH domain-containing protein n=1 Tax=Agaricus bisporus var. burnettii (strain JB137-S8 / ATCC MYA-4627 / FGSC 10392) TaxID=597362 RepID=K5XK39_AGABU|nr:uncharacterized protein AGABI1DRAFT_51126 [Agaricus bisporus var. burnettii JB137-S8]EKM83722.1 hypothetical protein AGABI1DRAFT_51126 [Agaricus bisporus var. burnettii JB137-S8]
MLPDYLPRQPPRLHPDPPALSSAGSSSTRSSAYTTSAAPSSDYSFIHVASPDDDHHDVLSNILAKHDHPPRPTPTKPLPEHGARWSESYSSGVRSRSSSLGNNSSGHGHDANSPNLKEKLSYDLAWIVDEKDEVGLSEDETDDDQPLVDDRDPLLDHEERTSAAVIADEGRGLIVQADSTPIVHLQVQPGTTHLLIGSSPTPNAVPSFLTNTLPQICHSLLALDISTNFLGALPPVLAVCTNLEELNVASNPLRVLPVFLADLANLRVLIADSTGITTLPDSMVGLDKLHTISIRRNKLHALPGWLCMLPALQTLCIDHNPFQGPWKALVEPLLAKTPMTPFYPPPISILPQLSANRSDTEADSTDIDDVSDSEPNSGHQATYVGSSPEDEDQTIMPDRASHLGRARTSPLPTNGQPSRGLSRTRTTPNRAYYDQNRAKSAASIQERLQNAPPMTRQQSETAIRTDRELRKMKSAGDLRRGKSTTALAEEVHSSIATSQSSTNIEIGDPPLPALPPINKRYGSLGPASSLGSPKPRSNTNAMRPQLSKSLWENPSEPAVEPSSTLSRMSLASPSMGPMHSPHIPQAASGELSNGKASHRSRSSRDGKDKSSRWGFLKKMSMGRIKVEPVPPLPQKPLPSIPADVSTANDPTPERFNETPQIDLRFSTTGSLDVLSPDTLSQVQKMTASLQQQSSSNIPTGSPSIPPTGPSVPMDTTNTTNSDTLLVPPAPTSRANKRRSFLPIDSGLNLNIPIPDNFKFIPSVTATSDLEDIDERVATPSPTTEAEQYLRREEERAREAYMRALRSVMAYLKDMNDLSLSQQQMNPLSIYGQVPEEVVGRPRRPTTADSLREVSMALSGTTIAHSSGEGSSQLRPAEMITGLRSGTSSQTMSIATTDSNGSSEERKYKDDKGKRAMIIKEILLTERTYVKGLQELVDIYIKPSSMPVNILSGVGSTKDTVVPMSERKIVFGGIDSLFSFHNESFLPALEKAAAPMMQTREELQHADVDGQLSTQVAKAVGDIFVKHAAFMRMYSSYINNFDNSVQRIKHWTSDKQPPSTAPSSVINSPTSSTVQLASIGLSMSSVVPGVHPDGLGSTSLPNLSASQRRRLKAYLKRCRMNPRHTQLNLEGYLLLPVQRIPRYRLLLEELLRNTPPAYEFMDDPLDRALVEISSLANNMNEGKRESESRRKLVQWQSRIRGRFPSPLVQPHRRLIMDGPLLLTRVVRKAVVSFDSINSHGDSTSVQVDCLAPELTPRPLIGILCNDLLVLCRDPSEGQEPSSQVDLWAVLRMQTLPQPASIVHGNALRLVDNKAILYFDAPSPSDALNWYRAINLHIPASKT